MSLFIQRFYTMLLVSVFVPAAAAQWTLIASPPNVGNLYCIGFLGDDTGFIGCDRGMLKSFSGGLGWFYGFQQTYAVHGLAFPNETVGYAAAEGGRILKTNSSGATWTNVQTNNTPWVTFRAISSPDFLTAYAIGTPSVIRKTSDGGITWPSSSFGAVPDEYNQIHFFDANVGVIVGDGGNIRRCTTAGAPWWSVPSGTTSNLYDLHFPSTTTGYAVGANGTILKSTDGGQTWISLNSGATTTWYAVSFENDLAGYVAGQGDVVLKTLDGGATWEQEQMEVFSPTGRVNDLFFHAGRYITAGDSGRIALHDALVGIQEHDAAEQDMTILPNPAANNVTLSAIGLTPGPVQISFANAVGQLVQSFHITYTGADLHMDVSTLPAGLYTCELRHALGVRVARMLKE